MFIMFPFDQRPYLQKLLEVEFPTDQTQPMKLDTGISVHPQLNQLILQPHTLTHNKEGDLPDKLKPHHRLPTPKQIPHKERVQPTSQTPPPDLPLHRHKVIPQTPPQLLQTQPLHNPPRPVLINKDLQQLRHDPPIQPMLTRMVGKRAAVLVDKHGEKPENIPEVRRGAVVVHQQVQTLDGGVGGVARVFQLFQECGVGFEAGGVAVLQLVERQQELLEQVLFLDYLPATLGDVLDKAVDGFHEVDCAGLLLLGDVGGKGIEIL